MENIVTEKLIDPNVQIVVDKMKSRMEFGYNKYGCTTYTNKADYNEFLTHLEEELMDSLVYIQAIKQRVESIKYDDMMKSLKIYMNDETNEVCRASWKWVILASMVSAGCDFNIATVGADKFMDNMFNLENETNDE